MSLNNQVFDPAETLRDMIVGDKPMNLGLMRDCACALCADSAAEGVVALRDVLVETVELLDLAAIFDMPENIVEEFRTDALSELVQIKEAAGLAMPASAPPPDEKA